MTAIRDAVPISGVRPPRQTGACALALDTVPVTAVGQWRISGGRPSGPGQQDHGRNVKRRVLRQPSSVSQPQSRGQRRSAMHNGTAKGTKGVRGRSGSVMMTWGGRNSCESTASSKSGNRSKTAWRGRSPPPPGRSPSPDRSAPHDEDRWVFRLRRRSKRPRNRVQAGSRRAPA